MISHLFLLLIHFVTYSSSQSNTIDASCDPKRSDCGAGQTCVDNKCQCQPPRKFYSDEARGCVNCPNDFVRLPKRCFKYFPEGKTRNAAQADCQRNQADLFSWKDNLDQSDLITAAKKEWRLFDYGILYSWSGGIVHNSGGSTSDFKITWFDPRGPQVLYPSLSDSTSRYCNRIQVPGYDEDSEPTRLIRNGEREDCVSIVFVSDSAGSGRICLADDFCSSKMSYLCEITPASLSGHNPLATSTKATSITTTTTTATTTSFYTSVTEQQSGTSSSESIETTDEPSALGAANGTTVSNKLVLAIAGVVLVAVIGSIAFVIMRKRKQKDGPLNMSPTASVANSTFSREDISSKDADFRVNNKGASQVYLRMDTA